MVERRFIGRANDRCSALKDVYEASFAIDDIGLYLNTHPCDKEARALYECMVLAEKEAEEAYMESTCRPIMQIHSARKNVSAWHEKPWPWEGEY